MACVSVALPAYACAVLRYLARYFGGDADSDQSSTVSHQAHSSEDASMGPLLPAAANEVDWCSIHAYCQ